MKKLLLNLTLLALGSQLYAQTPELVFSGSASSLSVAGKNVYFASYDTADFKYKPYFTAGTPATSVKLSNCECQSQQFSPAFIATSQHVFFACSDSAHGGELWASNGSPATTRMVSDIAPGVNSSLSRMDYYCGAGYGDKLLFAPNSGSNIELWSSDGNASGTAMLADIVSGTAGSAPNFFYNVGDKVFFFGSSQAFSSMKNLYITDGTAANTNKMNELQFAAPDGGNGKVRQNTLFFGVQDNMNQTAIYGAHPIYNPSQPYNYFRTIATATANSGFEVMDSFVYYTSFHITVGRMLLKQHILTGVITDTLAINGTGLSVWTLAGNKIFFTSFSPSFQIELWVTDGTKAGTMKLITLNESTQCQSSGSSAQAVVHKNKMYFMNCDSIHGTELWVTDGTVAGTHYVCETNVGVNSSNTMQMVVAGDYLYFDGSDSTYNQHLWRIQIDTGNVGTGLMSLTTGAQEEIMVYPNPASTYVSLSGNEATMVSISGTDGKVIKEVNVSGTNGFSVSDLPNGIYFLHISGSQFRTDKKLVVMHE